MTATDITSISWGSGEPITGTPFREVVASDATDGRLVVLAVDMAPNVRVDEHAHDDEDQIMVVVSGSIGATVGDREVVLGDGAVLFMPRGVPHSLWNRGDEPARMLELYTPGGFEQVFRAAGQRALAGEPSFFA